MNQWLKPWRWWPLRVGAETFEVDQPWVVYRFMTRDERTRVTGRTVIECECAVCGAVERLRLRIPRVGKVEGRGHHPERLRFLRAHVHENRPAQMAWARPLLNPWASGPVDLDALAMRLEADLRDALRERGGG